MGLIDLFPRLKTLKEEARRSGLHTDVSPEEFVDSFFNEITKPISNCTQFYVMYYLTDIAGVKELQNDFNIRTERLYTAFMNYGVYSVASELTHLADKFTVKDVGIDQLPRDKFNEFMEMWLYPLRHEEYHYKGDPQYFRDVVTAFGRQPTCDQLKSVHPDIGSKQEIVEFFEELDTVKVGSRPLNIIKNRYEFFRAAEKIFNTYGWQVGYGKEAWAKVARALIHFKDISKVMVVDSSWNLQHNMGIWLNKVRISQDKAEDIAMILEESSSIETVVPSMFLKTPTADSVWNHFLPYILDSQRVGDMEELWHISSEFNPRLRKYEPYFK